MLLYGELYIINTEVEHFSRLPVNNLPPFHVQSYRKAGMTFLQLSLISINFLSLAESTYSGFCLNSHCPIPLCLCFGSSFQGTLFARFFSIRMGYKACKSCTVRCSPWFSSFILAQTSLLFFRKTLH